MMDVDDVENGNAIMQEEEKIAVPAMRRQNRWFACAATMFLLGGAAFVLTKNYTSPSELPVDVFDQDGGTVGEEADNSKMQEAKTAKHNPASPGKNPFHIPSQDVNNAGHKSDLQDIMNLRHNRTNSKQNAVLEHWNRNHPGEPLPDRYNFSLTHDRHGNWDGSSLYNKGGKKQNPFWDKTKKHGNEFPTKTNEDADEEEPLEDGGHHGMDPHGDEIIRDSINTKPVAEDKPNTPAKTPGNVFGSDNAAVPLQKPAAPEDSAPEDSAPDSANTNTEEVPVEEKKSPEDSDGEESTAINTEEAPVEEKKPQEDSAPVEEKKELEADQEAEKTEPQAADVTKTETTPTTEGGSSEEKVQADNNPVDDAPHGELTKDESTKDVVTTNEDTTKVEDTPAGEQDPKAEATPVVAAENPATEATEPTKPVETPKPPVDAATPEKPVPTDSGDKVVSVQDPNVRQEVEPLDPKTVAAKDLGKPKDSESIAKEVLKAEEVVETEDETNDSIKAAKQDVDAWHAGKVDMKSGIKYEIVKKLEHDHASFTQGLTFANGKLYESAGLYGKSTIRILDPETGVPTQVVPMDSKYFAEGMTFYDDKLVQIVWKKAIGFVYDANDLTAKPTEYTYSTIKNNEGWGITYDDDRHELIVTDGSPNLMFWDPDCWKSGHCEGKPEKPSVPVTRLDGTPAKELNEIEYWRGRVLANVWFSDVLLVIHPETGMVEKEYGKSVLHLCVHQILNML
jgi:glutamine cyclotransferase